MIKLPFTSVPFKCHGKTQKQKERWSILNSKIQNTNPAFHDVIILKVVKVAHNRQWSDFCVKLIVLAQLFLSILVSTHKHYEVASYYTIYFVRRAIAKVRDLPRTYWASWGCRLKRLLDEEVACVLNLIGDTLFISVEFFGLGLCIA